MAHVLVVDDEQSIRELLRTILETEGYEVREATDGAEALESIQERMPDLVLLDLNMPGMHGWRFLDELYVRGLRDRLRVIVVSALAEVAAPGSVPSRRVLAKPFDIDALLNLVEQTLTEEPETIRASTDKSQTLIKLIDRVESLLG